MKRPESRMKPLAAMPAATRLLASRTAHLITVSHGDMQSVA